jgi:hypothetical protein
VTRIRDRFVDGLDAKRSVHRQEKGRTPGLIRTDRFTSILLKNSDFRFDHNLEDRWRLDAKFLRGSAD